MKTTSADHMAPSLGVTTTTSTRVICLQLPASPSKDCVCQENSCTMALGKM